MTATIMHAESRQEEARVILDLYHERVARAWEDALVELYELRIPPDELERLVRGRPSCPADAPADVGLDAGTDWETLMARATAGVTGPR